MSLQDTTSRNSSNNNHEKVQVTYRVMLPCNDKRKEVHFFQILLFSTKLFLDIDMVNL